MKPFQLCKSSVPAFCFFILFLIACNDHHTTDKVASLHAEKHGDTSQPDNEIKNMAPDANSKMEQGYALPRHTQNQAQSPIDIISGRTFKTGREILHFVFHSDIDMIENLGHTIELEFKEGSNCLVNGKEYACKQFHFHTPSEHLLDGITFPMEMHIVNALAGETKEKTSYLVVGVFFKMGNENKFLKEFLDKIPAKEGEKSSLQTGQVNLDDLLSQVVKSDTNAYYTYNGSLTTPPFSENVQWVIMKQVVEASEEQIMTIEKLEGNNARHVQAINDRKVYSQ